MLGSTFLSPSTCGFARVLALEASRKATSQISRVNRESQTKYKARVLQETYKIYKSNFAIVQENFNPEFSKFTKKLSKLKEYFNKWNFRKLDEKKKYLDTFSSCEWEKLSDIRKCEHSFENCRGCSLRYADVEACFPVKSLFLKGEATKNPVFNAESEASRLRSQNGRVVNPKKRDIKNTAKAIYDKVSPVFEKNYGVTLAEALSKSPDLDLQYKSQNDTRCDRRSHYREAKASIESQLAETAFIR